MKAPVFVPNSRKMYGLIYAQSVFDKVKERGLFEVNELPTALKDGDLC